MMVHAPPRMLKMGKAGSNMIPSVGRGIVIGCKRSQSMANAYTNRHADNLWQSFHIELPKPSQRPRMIVRPITTLQSAGT